LHARDDVRGVDAQLDERDRRLDSHRTLAARVRVEIDDNEPDQYLNAAK
jgi:hypothetical protein